MAHIGFVGLGHMGLPMACNLIKAGHIVTGFDLQSSALNALVACGGHKAASLADAGHSQDVVITMLQTGEQVLDVCQQENGLFYNANKNTLFIDCSSIDVQSARQYHQRAEENNLLAVEAPVSGGVAGAKAGSLTFMVGGDEKAVSLAKPILAQMGKKVIHTGAAGSGQTAKICNNMILGISMIAISEAFILAKELGLEPQKLFEVVTNASGQCWAMSNYVPVPDVLSHVPANHNYEPGFTSAMMLKDLTLSQQAAQKVGINTPLGEKAMSIYRQFIESGQGALDFSAIIKSLSTK